MSRWIAFPLAILSSAASAHVCWIEQVVTEATGVRVFYQRSGMGSGFGLFDSDYIAPGKPLNISRSAHGSCTLEAIVKDGRIGVSANAIERTPGIEKAGAMQEWIEAVPPSPPYVPPIKVELARIVN